MAGFWPMPTRFRVFYYMWTMLIFITIGTLFPISQIVNIFFAKSVTEMAERMVITSSVIVVAAKAFILYINRKGLDDLLQLLKDLDGEIQERSHINQLNSAVKLGRQMYIAYLFPYISTCVLLVFQTIYSRPENRMWSSTYAYPFEWAQRPAVYVSGLFIHGFSNTSIVIFALAVDTYGVILIHIVTTHIVILQERLQLLGKNRSLSDAEQYNQLVYCCKLYEKILK